MVCSKGRTAGCGARAMALRANTHNLIPRVQKPILAEEDILMAVFDIHVHTLVYSGCSFICPEELIDRAVQAGLDGLAITEHGMRWPDGQFGDLRQQAARQNIVLINGQEIPATSPDNALEGEFLVFGVSSSLTGRYTAKELVGIVHGEGGILIAAHPYKLSRNGRSRYYGAGDLVYDLGIDAIELCHPDHGEQAMKRARRAMAALGIPGTGGSDAHKNFMIGSHVTLFENEVRSEVDFIDEIRRGTVRAERRF